jgi:hypothetical protein
MGAAGDWRLEVGSLIRSFYGHHKGATTWIRDILLEVARRRGLVAEYLSGPASFEGDLATHVEKHGLNLVLYPNADIEFVRPLHQAKRVLGFHVIRDPRDIVVSAYFSHRESHVPGEWLREHRLRLQSLPIDEGLLVELDFANLQRVMGHMDRWDYDQPNVLELRMEDVTGAPRAYWTMILRQLQLDDAHGLDELLQIVSAHEFAVLAGGRKPGEEDPASHYRKGLPGDWRNYFDAKHIDAFKARYGPLVIKLGYEENDQWGA